MLKSAERNYSATKWEALGVKEALVKFQPFIKGGKNIVIMDHAAIVWARTYKNENRRLATWVTVFGAPRSGHCAQSQECSFECRPLIKATKNSTTSVPCCG